MHTRREVLQGLSALALSPVPMSPPLQPRQRGAALDEAYWDEVRARFELRPDRINLVTVVRGVTTRANREIMAQATANMNAFRAMSPDPDWRAGIVRKVATFVGADPADVALVRNTTEGVTTVLMNWPLDRGDEILTSSTEHGAFYDTLAQRAHRDGISVRQFHYPAPPNSPDAIVAAIEAAMTPRTKLVMIGHVVLTGLITPVRAIADLVHRRGARPLVDGVLAIGHVPVDVKAMDCDFDAAGFHKWGCGPRATAVFYVRPEFVARLPAATVWRDGGNRGGSAAPVVERAHGHEVRAHRRPSGPALLCARRVARFPLRDRCAVESVTVPETVCAAAGPAITHRKMTPTTVPSIRGR